MTFYELDDDQLILLHEKAHNYILNESSSVQRMNGDKSCIVKSGVLSTHFQADGEIATFCLLHTERLCNIFEIVDLARSWGISY